MQPSYDLAPAAAIAIGGAALAVLPAWWSWRRANDSRGRLRALTMLTLVLTFDLVLFGAFTRLTDSGLGCPDWPGCYGHASPLGAHGDIQAAQSAMPTGPVTHGKAWIEMTHRYLATAVGALITLLAVWSWRVAGRARRDAALSPWWATTTLLWVCAQGAFGALTVTMKLYPAVVTAHLLGGLGLLVLLAVQGEAYRPATLRLSIGLRRGLWVVAALALAQITLGGWVSTNYAVLACQDFPTCQRAWWPAMDFEHGFTVFRELGAGRDGGYLPFAALTAIHVTHRIGAALLVPAAVLLAWRLFGSEEPVARRFGWGLLAVLGWQVASGLGNVMLGWPLLSAVAHTGGAAALVVLLTRLITRSAFVRHAVPAPRGRAGAGLRARTVS